MNSPPELMTYRVGSWLVDAQHGKVGQLMGDEGPYVQLRPPGGGREWDARPEALRLASVDERRQAGVTQDQGHLTDAVSRRAFLVHVGGVTEVPEPLALPHPPDSDTSAEALAPVRGRS